MSATELISDATGAANSSDVTITTTPLLVSLKDYDNAAKVYVFAKDNSGNYQQIGQLDASRPDITLSTAGVFRFSRAASSSSCGVFSA